MSSVVRTVVRNATLLGGVLLAAVLLAVAIVRLPPVQRWTAARIAARLPAGVRVQRAAITLVPPGVRLAQVSLPGADSTLQSVIGRLRITALLAGRIEIRTVIVDGANLTIEHTADGALQLWGAVAAPGDTETTGGGPPAVRLPPLETLPALLVKDANVAFVDRAARHDPRTLQFRAVRLALGAATRNAAPLTVSARLDPAGRIDVHGTLGLVADAAAPGVDHAVTATATATATGLDAQTVLGYLAATIPGGGTAKANGALDASLTVTGSLPGGLAGDVTLSQTSGSVVWDEVNITSPLKLSAHVTASPDTIALSDGQLTAAQLVADRVTASDLDAAFTYADRTLTLTTGRASIYGGTWTEQGTVTLADPPVFDATVRADDIGCAALLTAVTGAAPQFGCERLSADAVVHGRWTGAKRVTRNSEGSGSVNLRGGTIPASSIIGALWQAMVPMVHSSTNLGAVAAPSRVDHLTQSFTLQAGRLRTRDLTLVTDDYTITGTGSVGLDGSLDLNTEVAMTPEGITKLLTMASLPIPGELATLPPIPTRITGSVNIPIIRPEVDRLPVAALRTLFAGARGAGGALDDAANNGLRTLRHGIDPLW